MNQVHSTSTATEVPAPGSPGSPGNPGSAGAPGPHHGGPNGGGNGSAHAHAEEHVIPADLPKVGTFTVIAVALVFVLLLAALLVIGLVPHLKTAEQSRADAADMAKRLPVVSVMSPKANANSTDIFLPADVRPNQETAIYARANGYLKTLFNHDINDHVKAGELLAEIATPEIDAQLEQNRAALEQAKANVIRAQADLDLAQRSYKRYDDSAKESAGSVTVQQLDERRSAYEDAVAALAQAKANVDAAAAAVKQLEVLVSFEKIIAPFSGTITARNYDVGALMGPANSSPPNLEVFRLSQTDPLRVFVSVPQTYAAGIKVGGHAYLSVRNYPSREFEGTVTRTAAQLETITRTLLVETQFPNHDGTLFPGMYGQVRLKVEQQTPTLTVPTSALVFNASGLQIGTVRDGKFHLSQITVGRDFGKEIEVTSGLAAGDQVVTNPGLRVGEGLEVQVKQPEKTDKTAAADAKPQLTGVREAAR